MFCFSKQFPALNAGGSRYRPQAKKPRLSNNFIKDTWTHKFCALSYKDTSVSPNTRELMELNQVGLGIEKVVFPSKTGTHAMLLEELTKAYPKLSSQSGGIELLRAESGGINRPLVLIPPRKDGYSISYLKNLVPGHAVIYIRPVQSDLPMEEPTMDSGIEVNCVRCNQKYPLNDLRFHQAYCQLDDDIFPEMIDDEAGPSNEKEVGSTSPHIDTLSAMFPRISKATIQDILRNTKSIDVAANILSEKSASENMSDMLQIKCVDKDMSLKEILNQITSLASENDTITLEIERDNLWMESLRFYKRNLVNSQVMTKKLIIEFKGEDGLDGGAMKTEYFNLLLEEVKNRLFEGENNSLLPVKDITKAVLFKVAGMIIVHSLIAGVDTGFPVLAKPYFLHMCGRDTDSLIESLNKSHIPANATTENLIELIESLDQCKTKDDIDKLLYKDNQKQDVFWSLINSAHWPADKNINKENVPLLVQQLILNDVILSRRNSSDMLFEGLSSCNFLNTIRCHWKVMDQIFCAGYRMIESKEFIKCFSFDEPTSFVETQAKKFFLSFIEKSDSMTLSKVLAFCTSHTVVPLDGMKNEIRVKYMSDDEKNSMCKSSACLKIIYLPTVHSVEKAFHNMLATALACESKGFANP